VIEKKKAGGERSLRMRTVIFPEGAYLRFRRDPTQMASGRAGSFFGTRIAEIILEDVPQKIPNV
jgi:hypothetical protein